jgi:hypothetical protein
VQLPVNIFANIVLILKIRFLYVSLQHVMKFAEMTQEIQMAQPMAMKLDFGLTPGRRKANEVSLIYKIISTVKV